jgi:hypothetical protein
MINHRIFDYKNINLAPNDKNSVGTNFLGNSKSDSKIFEDGRRLKVSISKR